MTTSVFIFSKLLASQCRVTNARIEIFNHSFFWNPLKPNLYQIAQEPMIESTTFDVFHLNTSKIILVNMVRANQSILNEGRNGAAGAK